MGLSPQGVGMAMGKGLALSHRAWDAPMEPGVDDLGSLCWARSAQHFVPTHFWGSRVTARVISWHRR